MKLQHYPLIRQGKVRDIYDAGNHLILVATDRLSAFDVILPTEIPGKGEILTQLSTFWFNQTSHLMPNHLVSTAVSGLNLTEQEAVWLRNRTMIVQKAERIDIECVVRGYLAGSGYKEYAQNGTLAGEPLPTGLLRADMLPAPAFTPAVKNDEGHDVNISRHQLSERIGDGLALQLERKSLEIYRFANDLASRAGIILADTKFEFGFIAGELSLIDEVLTPDSSRYWEAESVHPGSEPASFDKQIVRNWLETLDWDKTAPGPAIPAEIVERTLLRYQEVYDRLITEVKGTNA